MTPSKFPASWYRLSTYGSIERVVVLSETETLVQIEGERRRPHKTTECTVYRPSKEACYQWLSSVRRNEIEAAERNLDYAKNRLSDTLEAARKDGVDL